MRKWIEICIFFPHSKSITRSKLNREKMHARALKHTAARILVIHAARKMKFYYVHWANVSEKKYDAHKGHKDTQVAHRVLCMFASHAKVQQCANTSLLICSCLMNYLISAQIATSLRPRHTHQSAYDQHVYRYILTPKTSRYAEKLRINSEGKRGWKRR